VLPPLPVSPTRPLRTGAATPTGGHPAQPVEVRTEGAGTGQQPAQLLWRGRLWLVPQSEQLGAVEFRGSGSPDGQRWRVRATDGAAGPVAVLDLVRSSTGGWVLHEEGA